MAQPQTKRHNFMETPSSGSVSNLTDKALRAEEKRMKAIADAEEAQNELDEIERETQEEQYAFLQRRRNQREAHLLDAAGLREMARTETDPEEKKKLLALALADIRAADEIARDLGIEIEAEAPEAKPKLPFLKRPIVAISQVAGVLLLITFAYKAFNQFHDYIQKLNQHLAPEHQLQPYDLTSIQKFFYEKMVVFSDLPVALLIVFLIVPVMGFYVLPIIKSKRDFYTEFNEDLTAWQRILITTVTFLGVLFFLALSHSVKP